MNDNIPDQYKDALEFEEEVEQVEPGWEDRYDEDE